MPFGEYGRQARRTTPGVYVNSSDFEPYNPYSPSGRYVLGGGNPGYFGRGDTATQTRQFANVGKANINLLDPLSAERAANEYVPIDQPPDNSPIASVARYYDPSTPGGLFSGLIGAGLQTVGGIFGEQAAQTGAQVGQTIGKTLEIPMTVLGSIGLEGVPFVAPIIDQANSAIEEHSPYILRDTVKIPKNIGGAFQSLLNVFGLLGRAVERTYAGSPFRDHLPEDIQQRIDAGELTQDQGIDEAVLSSRGFTDDPWHNMVFSILTDPANWASLGVGAVGGAVRGTAAISRTFGAAARAAEEGSAIYRAIEAGGQLGRIGEAARAGEAVTPLATRATLGQMRALLDDAGHPVHLRMVERLGMSALGPVSEETGNAVARIGHVILRATDPVNFFSGSRAGQRSMEALSTAASTSVMAALKPKVVNRLAAVGAALSPDGEERWFDAIGTWGGNALQEEGMEQMSGDVMRSQGVPKISSMSTTESVRAMLTGGAFDTNIGKYIEQRIHRTKSTVLGTLSKEEVYQQTVAKLAAIFGADAGEVARVLGDSVSLDEAIAVHGAYYYMKGNALHGDVMTAIEEAGRAGALPKGIRPADITMISPRTLTKQKAAAILEPALKSGDVGKIRSAIEEWDDFNWANESSLPDDELVDAVTDWFNANGPNLIDEIPLKDAAGNFLPGLPDELRAWAQDADVAEYGIGHGIPEDAPLEAQWQVTRNKAGKVINAKPWLRFATGDGDSVKKIGRWGQVHMAMTRGIRQESIVWQQRRRFITDMSKASEDGGVDIPPKLADRIFHSLMYEAKERFMQPRGMEPREMMNAVQTVLKDARDHNGEWDNIAGHLTERQIVLGLLRATQGDLSLVGATQRFTGGVKAHVPGAAGNYWGQISERLYPLMRFTLNPVFQAMELVEPYIMTGARGIGLPLRRDSEGFQSALASRNAIEQLVRHSGDVPDGLMDEMAETLAINRYQGTEAAAKFGRKTPWSRLSPNTAARKNAAAALVARKAIGDNLYEAFRQMKGDQFEQFWGDLEYQLGTSNRATIADRWLALNFSIADSDGFRVGMITDLLNHKNIGQRFRFSRDGRPGTYTHADVEELLDHARNHRGETTRASRGLKPGEALREDLKAMTRDEWYAEAEKAGYAPRVGRIVNWQADEIWRMSTGPTAKEFWKGYRDAFLRGVVAPTGTPVGAVSSLTRKLRDTEIKQAQALVRAFASSMDLTEEEFIARHLEDVPVYDATRTAGPPHVLDLFDIRGNWARDIFSRGQPQAVLHTEFTRAARMGDTHPLEATLYERSPADTEGWLYAVGNDYTWTSIAAGGKPEILTAYQDVLYDDPLRAMADHTGAQGPILRVRKSGVQAQGARVYAYLPEEVFQMGSAGQYGLRVSVDHLSNETPVEVLTPDGWRVVKDVVQPPMVGQTATNFPPQPGAIDALFPLVGDLTGEETVVSQLDVESTVSMSEDLALHDYVTSGHRPLNAFWRGTPVPYGYQSIDLDEALERSAELDRFIQRGTLDVRTTLHRGTKWRNEDTGLPHEVIVVTADGQHVRKRVTDLEVGDTFYDPGYFSMSRHKQTAEAFEGGGALWFDIDAPAGMHVGMIENADDWGSTSRISGTGMHEAEMLGPRGMLQRVTSKDDTTAKYGDRRVAYGTQVVGTGVPPGVNRLAIGEVGHHERNANMIAEMATHDPDRLLRQVDTIKDPMLWKEAQRQVRRAIELAKQAGPTMDRGAVIDGRVYGRIEVGDHADEIERVLTTDEVATYHDTLADLRGRLTDLASTRSWHNLDVSDNNDTRLLSALSAFAPYYGARRSVELLFETMDELVRGGPAAMTARGAGMTFEDSLVHTAMGYLLRRARISIRQPKLRAIESDAQDAILGNTSRRATGRTSTMEPIIADDIAADAAGFVTRGAFRDTISRHGIDTGEGVTEVSLGGQVLYVDPTTHEVMKPRWVPAEQAAVEAAPAVGGGMGEPFHVPHFDIPDGDLEFVGNLGGSTGAKLYSHYDTGARYVDKMGVSTAHVREESLADTIYEALGAAVVPHRLITLNGYVTKRSTWLEDVGDGAGSAHIADLGTFLETASEKEQKAILWQLQQHFALDALLANYDVGGMFGDNIMVREGVAYRIDNGGSMRYRAQGAYKQWWGEEVGELDSMRDADRNKWAYRIFGDLTDEEIGRQIVDIVNQRERLLALVDDAALKETLDLRIGNMVGWGMDRGVVAAGPGVAPHVPVKVEAPAAAAAVATPPIADKPFSKLPDGKTELNYIPQAAFAPGEDVGLIYVPGHPIPIGAPGDVTDAGWMLFDEPVAEGVSSAGVVITEPDGRVWVYEPANHFGGYEHTWPKGRGDVDEDWRDVAIREAEEELGFTVRLTGHIGDFDNVQGTSRTRYYHAIRTGGGPHAAETAETAAIKLVTPEEARSILIHDGVPDTRDLAVLDASALPPTVKPKVASAAPPTNPFLDLSGSESFAEYDDLFADDPMNDDLDFVETPTHDPDIPPYGWGDEFADEGDFTDRHIPPPYESVHGQPYDFADESPPLYKGGGEPSEPMDLESLLGLLDSSGKQAVSKKKPPVPKAKQPAGTFTLTDVNAAAPAPKRAADISVPPPGYVRRWEGTGEYPWQELDAADHEYMTYHYTQLAAELNRRAAGGMTQWTAAQAAMLASRVREKQGRVATSLADEVARTGGEVAGSMLPGGGSNVEYLRPVLDLLQQKRHRTERHKFWSEVGPEMIKQFRDRLGVVMDDFYDLGIGFFDGPGRTQPNIPMTVVSTPDRLRDAVDAWNYVTGQARTVGFSPGPSYEELKASGASFHPYTLRLTVEIDGNTYPTIMERIAHDLGENLDLTDVTAYKREDGTHIISIIDTPGRFKRLDNGEADLDDVTRQLNEAMSVQHAHGEFEVHQEYGDVYEARPPADDDLRPDWSRHRDQTVQNLKARNSPIGGPDLDHLRAAYEDTIKRHGHELSPLNADRSLRGERISHELEDRRGGEVLGLTSPRGESASVIRGFGAADPLTGIHELVHVFSRAAMDHSLREAVIGDWGKYSMDGVKVAGELEAKAAATASKSWRNRYLAKATAVREGLADPEPGAWNKQHEEYLVKLIFQWMDNGVAPTPEMAQVFNHFRNWIELSRKALSAPGMPPVRVSPAMEARLARMTTRKGVDTVEYSIEQQAQRMAALQVVKSSWDEAYANQFYKRDRSWMERSINHPYIGLYPASYMWGKVLPEMVRFLALRPFGLETPFLAWNVAREIGDSVKAQSETDESFRKFLSDNEDAFMLMSMFFPALPQEIPANASLPVRRIAEQGLENQAAYASGVDPSSVKDIDYMRGASDAMFYALGPAGTVRTVSESLGNFGNLARSGANLVTGGAFFPEEEEHPTDPNGLLPLR